MRSSPNIDEIILIGNYPHDQMRSMDLFAATLQKEIKKLGIHAILIKPAPFFGNIVKGPTGLGKWLGYLDKFILFPKALKKIQKTKKDLNVVYHICDQSNAHYIKYLPVNKTLVTVHDLMAIQAACGDFLHIKVSWTGKRLQQFILTGIQRTKYFTCVSEATKQTLIKIHKEESSDIDVIPNALVQSFEETISSHDRWEHAKEPQIQQFIGDKPYLLHVGNDNWYKNRDGLFEIFEKLRESNKDLALVLVGPPPSDEQLATLSKNTILHICNLVNLDESDLNILYRKAELLLFPSIMEGFGWPILEALSCACPVSIIQRAPMTEIAGTTGLYLNHPDDFLNRADWVNDSCAKVSLFLMDNNRHNTDRQRQRLKQSERFLPETIFPQYVVKYQKVSSSNPS